MKNVEIETVLSKTVFCAFQAGPSHFYKIFHNESRSSVLSPNQGIWYGIGKPL